MTSLVSETNKIEKWGRVKPHFDTSTRNHPNLIFITGTFETDRGTFISMHFQNVPTRN